MKTFSVGYFLLGIQRALLDAVTSELRAVKIDIISEDQWVYVRFYYDGSVSEELIDLWECAITEATAGLGPNCRVDDGIERLDYPQKIPVRGHFAYLRKEGNQRKNDPKPNRALLKHKDTKFINQYLGNGKKMNDIEPGKPGYSEIVNFKEFIGYAINRETHEQMSTNWGIIHYSEGGVHIIPAYQGKIKDLKVYPLAYAKLAMQQALLGVVTPELRAIFVDFSEEENLLYIRFYYDGEVSKELICDWQCAISETCADLGPECSFDTGIERLDYPSKIPIRGSYVYLRRE